MHTFICHYRKQVIQKTVSKVDRGLLQVAMQIKWMCCLQRSSKENTELLSEVWFLKSACQQQKWQWVILSEDQDDDYQFTTYWSAIYGLHNMWHCSLGLWSMECQPDVRSTSDQARRSTRRARGSCRTLSNIPGCTARTGSNQKVYEFHWIWHKITILLKNKELERMWDKKRQWSILRNCPHNLCTTSTMLLEVPANVWTEITTTDIRNVTN